MTRIVGGSAGGRLLEVPARATRPTSDRVREALFSTLEGLLDFAGARVLDLFAGSGAVGLESASRGATHVTLVDSDRDAVAVARRNAESLGLSGVQIRQQTVEAYLGGGELTSSGEPPVEGFDLVFADPPYAYPSAALQALLAPLATAPRWLAEGAIVVIERSSRSTPPPWPVVIEPIKHKRYGDTALWYGQRK